jgi:hypothetical protein
MYKMEWRKRGGILASRRGRGGSVTFERQPCRYFKRGACKYGSQCRYSHEAKENPRSDSPSSEDDVEAGDQYLSWKALLRPKYNVLFPQYELHLIWKGALDILNGNQRGHQQSLAKDIADDALAGYRVIRDTMNIDQHAIDKSMTTAQVFLEVITHQDLLDCMSIDSYMGNIYSFFSGHNGGRAIPFLSDMCRHMVDDDDLSSASPALDRTSLIPIMFKALHELLRREPGVGLHESLPDIFDVVRRIIQSLPASCRESLKSHLDLMERLARMASNRIRNSSDETDAGPDKTGPLHSSLPRDVLLPYGRHDNDHAHIAQVQIFPTLEEILFDGEEYLPSTDWRQPHFFEDSVQRHIDCAFRLLRADTFSPVKEVLSGLLTQDSPMDPRFLLNKNPRAHFYMRSRILRLYIDEKRGLEAKVSFSEPPALRNMTPSEKRRWWEESSRLEEGGLVCFVSSEADDKMILFFEVTAKKTESTSDGDQESCLVSATHRPSICVKLVVRTRDALKLLIRIHREEIQGILVDFLSLIPATFVPVLETLRLISADGQVAFREWIVPILSEGGKLISSANIPPPSYARQGFVYSLSSITKDKLPGLSLDPSSVHGHDPLELATRTGLDLGQSIALIAALTREYALIQGPPGTGKSYIGIQIVRVLLENRRTANLGPILIM